MASGWQFHEDTTPTPGEVEAMVAVLEGRHGAWAADVAEFFSTLHSLKGDAGRKLGVGRCGRVGTSECRGTSGGTSPMRI